MRKNRRIKFGSILRSDDGIALVIVMWFLALLMVIVTQFIFSMRVEGGATGNFKDEAAAYYLAIAGMNRAFSEITGEYEVVLRDSSGRIGFASIEGGRAVMNEAERDFGLGEGRVSYVVEDESAKINLNIVSREVLGELMRLSGVEKTDRDIVVDSILDWRDENHEFHLNGAEDDYYGALSNPYGARDDNFESIEELLLVKGMTHAVLYGNCEMAGVAPGTECGGLSSHLTVNGEGRININTADEIVLEAVLGKGKAQEVLLRRETEGFFDKPAYGGLISSNVFTILARGEVRGIRSNIKVIAEREQGSSGITVRYWNIEGAR